ncbi:MAG: (d)CMP kinase [Microbacteriaceae bacterium]|nr:(d)CMP kinase [Microbacteriaceae bacterium]
MSEVVVVAVDGPAGSGKSSVSKAVARRLGYAYYDTGAAYRALAWAAVNAGIDLQSEDAVVAVQDSAEYVASHDPDHQVFHVDGVDVTEAIRGHEVSGSVSHIARHPRVRQGLVDHFRSVISACSYPGIVMEGRDITTVVAPDAQVRVLLTADEEVRIARRQAELAGVTAEPVAESLKARDRSDQSVVDFMNAAPGVALLDSGPLTFGQTVDAMLSLIDEALGGTDE